MDGFPRTRPEFNERFGSEAACREYLFARRWPNGFLCPRCDHAKGWVNDRRLIECAACGHQVSLTAGTIFHATKKPLCVWFEALFLMVSFKTGLSAKGLSVLLGVSYPTAWTWLHKLRQAMQARDQSLLGGVVEIDETYWGAKRKGRIGRPKGGQGQEMVLVAAETPGGFLGRVRLAHVASHTKASIGQAVATMVAPGCTVRTDGLRCYAQLGRDGYNHRPEIIGKDTARAARLFPHVHRVASLLKRWLTGTHQGAVRPKHLSAYLEEFEFRFNRRTSKHRTLLFERLVGCAVRLQAKPYWRILQRTAPNCPLPVGPT